MGSDIETARSIVDEAGVLVRTGTATLASRCVVDGHLDQDALDAEQAVAYDLAVASAAVAAAEALIERAADDVDERLALVFAAELAVDLGARICGRSPGWGVSEPPFAAVEGAVAAGRDPRMITELADEVLDRGRYTSGPLPEDLAMVRQTFRRFSDECVATVAERIHRNDEDIPETIIDSLAELGGFALSVPTAYGGLAEGGTDELAHVVIVTEELARGSLAVAGSLITRPEIMIAAILAGGTEEQKRRWLPDLATGRRMCAIAVTEPDVGSDVARVSTTARRDEDGWVLRGVKTWCTFAGRAELLLVLARTDDDMTTGHRGLSLFVVDKPPFSGHAWRVEQDGGGVVEGRAISTIGYRGMHSFEIAFDDWQVADDALIGGDQGIGQGFYLQMGAFATGRLQTAARANGVMEAAIEAAARYAAQRRLFGRALGDLALTRDKLVRMAAALAASRAMTMATARRLGHGDGAGQLEAAQAKQFACRSAEWVTREAQQLHGGYGYAEEYAVSRYFLDARVLSIFEGADELLALRVIARGLLARALAESAH